MNRRELFENLLRAASQVYDLKEAESVAYIIAEDLFDVVRNDIILDPFKTVERTERLREVLARIVDSEPVQYITGRAYFYGMKMEVGPGVLIPRQETEELVRWITDSEQDQVHILDVGTGSGAIAVSLALAGKGYHLTAVDISHHALRTTAINAARYGAQISLYHTDILDQGRHLAGAVGEKLFDIIVSNPPYIPRSERDDMHPNVVRHEPSLALFVPDSEPMLFYSAIISAGRRLLKSGGRIYFEIHEQFGEHVSLLLEEQGYSATLKKDINGRDRMVCGRQR